MPTCLYTRLSTFLPICPLLPAKYNILKTVNKALLSPNHHIYLLQAVMYLPAHLLSSLPSKFSVHLPNHLPAHMFSNLSANLPRCLPAKVSLHLPVNLLANLPISASRVKYLTQSTKLLARAVGFPVGWRSGS